VLPRTGDLRDVDLVADPLVLLAGRILASLLSTMMGGCTLLFSMEWI
jgi:hypothetical protein